MEKVLITGAGGQLGRELSSALQEKWGIKNVLLTDIKKIPGLPEGSQSEILDVLDKERLYHLIRDYKISQVYNLAAILSAKGEEKPLFAWKLNMEGHLSVLEAAKELKLHKVFWPSSIAVFGPDTPKDQTPQNTICNPVTVYGISKLAGEHWCAWYRKNWGVDVRSLRFPGLIGYKAMPGGGTTDYAVAIYHKALAGEEFVCYLEKDMSLPMMYMPDAVRATMELMDSPAVNTPLPGSYNLSAFSFSPAEITAAIRKIIPDFRIKYNPDYRQQIAEGWPKSIDDRQARKDWGWKEAYDLDSMTADILLNLKELKKDKHFI